MCYVGGSITLLALLAQRTALCDAESRHCLSVALHIHQPSLMTVIDAWDQLRTTVACACL